MNPLGYAMRLSEYHDYGRCGVAEAPDAEQEVDAKIDRLVQLFRESPHTVVHTGAGVSTAAGIPDFRGAGGVWTEKLQRGSPLPAAERCWNNAQPTYAHMALAALVEAGKVVPASYLCLPSPLARTGGSTGGGGGLCARTLCFVMFHVDRWTPSLPRTLTVCTSARGCPGPSSPSSTATSSPRSAPAVADWS